MIAVIGMIISTITANSVCIASFDGKPSESVKVGQKGLTSVNRHGCVFGRVTIYPQRVAAEEPQEELRGESPSSTSSDVFGNTRVEWPRGMVLFLDSERNIHRIDGPAVEDGTTAQFFCHGFLHNKAGPADFDEDEKTPIYALHGKKFDSISEWMTARESSPDCMEYE